MEKITSENVKIYGMDITNFQIINGVINETNIFHKIIVAYQINHRDNDILLDILIEYKYSNPSMGSTIISDTKTGFQILMENTTFIESPTNADSLKFFCNLTQIAISHARVYTASHSLDRELGNIILPITSFEELQKIVLEGLQSNLN